MNIGALGVISNVSKANAKKNQKNAFNSNKNELINLENELKEKSSNTLKFIQYPWLGWGLGLLMIISGLYLIYHISLGKYGSLFSEFREG